jgi:hypothetical protein
MTAHYDRRSFIKAVAVGGGVLGIRGTAALAQPADRADDQAPVLDDAAQLFVDLGQVEPLDGVRQDFHAADKHPANPVLRKEKPWESDRGTWGSVSFDPQQKIFKMWYGGQSGRRREYRPGSLTDASVLCYATSEDGLHWQRPELGQHEVMGTTKNNVVISDDHHNGMDHWESVLLDPLEADPQKRYKALGWSSYDWDGPGSGIYTMTSPDGLRWTHSPEPVFHYHPRLGSNDLGPVGDAHSLLIDTREKRYVAFLRSLPNRAFSVSRDFVNWTPPQLAIHARQGEVSNAVYNHMGFICGSQYIGLLTYFVRDPANPLLTVRLLSSRDGLHWDRPDTPQPLVDVGGIGQWDRFTNMITGAPPIRVGDRLYIYYRGLANRHTIDGVYDGKDDADRAGGGIGLATLRVDGFASLAASYSGGRVTTKLFRFVGEKLRVNAKSDSGRILVEVLDEAGAPIDGFKTDDCRPFSADTIAGQVEWENQPTLAPLKGRPVRLRFHLHNARLFSYAAG